MSNLNRRRVAMVIHVPGYGGLHNMAARLYGPLLECGWEATVILPCGPGSGAERLADMQIPVVQMPLSRPRFSAIDNLRFAKLFWRETSGLSRFLQRGRFDLLQAYGLTELQGPIAAYRLGLPIVWQLHSTYPPATARVLLSPLVRRVADVVMSTGMAVARAHPGIASLGPRLIPFFAPVDTTVFRPCPERRRLARAELGIPNDAILVATVGVLGRQKAHEYLIEAAGMVRQKLSNAYFRILGAPVATQAQYYDTNVVQKARAKGLFCGDVLRILNPGSRVADLMPAADIFVLSSIAEGAPTVVMEAMAAGVPVISTDVGSVRELVRHGETGIIVRPRRADLLARAIVALAADPIRRLEMARQARQYAVQALDVKICAQTHLAAYGHALERRSHLI